MGKTMEESNRFFPFWDFELGDCAYCKKIRVPIAKSPEGDKLCIECLQDLAKSLKQVSRGLG
jgi:hypothetical protein